MFEPTMIIAGASLVGLTIVASVLLRAWQGWLALKRQELERHYAPDDEKAGSSLGAARIIQLSTFLFHSRALERHSLQNGLACGAEY